MSEDLFGEVAPAHRFDEARLADYLTRHIEGFGSDVLVREGEKNRVVGVQVKDKAQAAARPATPPRPAPAPPATGGIVATSSPSASWWSFRAIV